MFDDLLSISSYHADAYVNKLWKIGEMDRSHEKQMS